MGINENLAREILELHTLGVNGGYTQADVTTFAQAISGWSIGGQDNGRRFARLGADNGTPGEFHFREAFHEPGARKLLGKSYGDDGLRQGQAILRDLALRRETARHISTKLARHFIADDPPPAVVERLTRAWLDSKGHLATVYAALVESPEALGTAAVEIQDAGGLYLFVISRAGDSAAGKTPVAAGVRDAGAAQSHAGIPGGLARYQR